MQNIHINKFTKKVRELLLSQELYKYLVLDIVISSDEEYDQFIQFLGDCSSVKEVWISKLDIRNSEKLINKKGRKTDKLFSIWEKNSNFLGLDPSFSMKLVSDMVKENPETTWYLPTFRFSDFKEEFEMEQKEYFIKYLKFQDTPEDMEKLENTKLRIKEIQIFWRGTPKFILDLKLSPSLVHSLKLIQISLRIPQDLGADKIEDISTNIEEMINSFPPMWKINLNFTGDQRNYAKILMNIPERVEWRFGYGENILFNSHTEVILKHGETYHKMTAKTLGIRYDLKKHFMVDRDFIIVGLDNYKNCLCFAKGFTVKEMTRDEADHLSLLEKLNNFSIDSDEDDDSQK